MKCPYNELDLKLAMIGMPELTTELETKFGNIKLEFPQTQAEINKAVAEHNGITLEMLINSPNMGAMITTYREILLLKLIDQLKSELGLTDKQAWALVVAGTGLPIME